MNKPLISSMSGISAGIAETQADFITNMPDELSSSLATVLTGLVVYALTYLLDRLRGKK